MTDTTTDLVITRVFDAPRELVFKAFIDPDQLAAWFGPVGFSVPRESVDIDARVGGHQRFVMVSDDDPSWASPVDSTITEYIENELFVGEGDFPGIPGVQDPTRIRLRIEFHDEDGGTRLVLRQGPYNPRAEGMAREGWLSSFTKLDKLLPA